MGYVQNQDGKPVNATVAKFNYQREAVDKLVRALVEKSPHLGLDNIETVYNTIGMYLDGEALRQRGPRGERLSDESYLLVLHAGGEDATFVLPGVPWATGYEVVVDTTYADGMPQAGNDRPAAGVELPVPARSAVLLRVVRTPIVSALSEPGERSGHGPAGLVS